MSTIYNIASYQPNAHDSFFVDANIWLFLLYPMADYEKQQQSKYSNFIDKVLKVGAQLYTSAQVLSEFVNKCISNEYNLKVPFTGHPNRKFKQDFRDTALYSDSLDQIILPSVRRILKLSNTCSDSFHTCDLAQMLNELSIVDFNDTCHLHIVRQNKWILITHDSDFGQINDDSLTVVTALGKLLRAG